MTREEAIELLDILPLCNECDSNSFPYTCVECGDAFLLAMEALKQPEVVRCKDCIFGEQINDRYICTNAGHCQSKSNKPDWFCADGERKGSN